LVERCENSPDLGVKMLYMAIVAPSIISPVLLVPIALERFISQSSFPGRLRLVPIKLKVLRQFRKLTRQFRIPKFAGVIHVKPEPLADIVRLHERGDEQEWF